jgi:hypothetical protein
VTDQELREIVRQATRSDLAKLTEELQDKGWDVFSPRELDHFPALDGECFELPDERSALILAEAGYLVIPPQGVEEFWNLAQRKPTDDIFALAESLTEVHA